MNIEPELGIAVMDQVTTFGLVRKCFPELLRNPRAGGILGDTKVHYAPAIMTEDEEAVENAKSKSRYAEEVHGSNSFAVIVEKCLPTSRGFWIFGSSLHPAGNGSFRDIESQLQEFAVNAGCTPGGILGDHLKNEVPYFPCDLLSAGPSGLS